MNSWIAIFMLTWLSGSPAEADTIQVRHDHDPWGQCRGQLLVTDDGIEYQPEKKEKHSRHWKWADIQSFDRKSAREFSILTYEDLKWWLGADRLFDFTVLPNQEPLSEATFGRISNGLGRPVTDRTTRQIEAGYQVPVKHLHTFGGCQGTLSIGQDWVSYQTEQPGHSRSWKRSRDIESVWSADRFHLDFHIFESNQRSFESTRRFRFQLKAPLDRAYYEQLRRELVADW